MKKEVIIVILIFIFLIANHLHDVGDIIYKRNYYCSIDDNKVFLKHRPTNLINGFFEINSNQLYHISWYISYLSFFILVLVALKKDGKEEEK